MRDRFLNFCLERPVAVTVAMVLSTLLLALLAALPSLAPNAFPMLHGVTIDTDPKTCCRPTNRCGNSTTG